ncbi:MAG: hypothetical protein IJS82_01440 [Paludibacteraceae bacterium]|nr:hypothetical protein [Paludibacteraceae bacterium]
MKKIPTAVLALMMTISAPAQFYIYLPNGGALQADSISVVAPSDDPNTPVTPLSEGVLSGEFSVSATKKVHFSQGNLQYQATTNTWRFADNQYTRCKTNGYIAEDYDGWIDLFGWGTSGYNNIANDSLAVNYQPWAKTTSRLNATILYRTEIDNINCEMQAITGKCDTTWTEGGTYHSDSVNYYGYGPSTYKSDKNLAGTSANYDWGVYNAITNGGAQAGLWRTLTEEEWEYILNGRPLAQYLRSQATVCDQHGYVLLPDDFTLPQGLSWSYQAGNWTTNTYDAQAWSVMESRGAVFLPAADHRLNTSVIHPGTFGYYWSTTHNGNGQARCMFFNSGVIRIVNGNRYDGESVRLVQDVQ